MSDIRLGIDVGGTFTDLAAYDQNTGALVTEFGGDSERSWAFDVALADLRDVVLPALDDNFAATRTKGVARLLKYLREADRLGPAYAAQERDELGTLLGQPVDDIETGRRTLCSSVEQRALGARTVLAYCLRQSARDTAIMRGAMGSLADRHFTRVRQLQGGTTR